MAQFLDNVELALVRIPSGASVVGASPAEDVRVSQVGGWVVVEGDVARFSLVVDQPAS